MSAEIWIAVVTTGGALMTIILRRVLHVWSENKLKSVNVLKEITDRQREDNVRTVDMMIAQVRSDAQIASAIQSVGSEIKALGEKIDNAMMIREKADEARQDELAALSKKLDKIERQTTRARRED